MIFNVYYDIYEMLRRKKWERKMENELLEARMSISWSDSRLAFYSERANFIIIL